MTNYPVITCQTNSDTANINKWITEIIVIHQLIAHEYYSFHLMNTLLDWTWWDTFRYIFVMCTSIMTYFAWFCMTNFWQKQKRKVIQVCFKLFVLSLKGRPENMHRLITPYFVFFLIKITFEYMTMQLIKAVHNIYWNPSQEERSSFF